MNPHDLPVYAQRKRILDALSHHQVIVVESPTGSGKTTQLPIILNEAGYAENGIIGITQPRRIAAMGVSRYIAGQLGCEVGSYVGYKMRFEDITGPETRLKILTDGTLLQEMKGDRQLGHYSVLMIDEAHERTLNIDFILGLLKQIIPQRPDLKILISSATLNPAVFSKYFDSCPIVSIDTPVFPVQIRYTPPPVSGDEDVLIGCIIAAVERIINQEDRNSGDILIFCTGEKMIKETVARLLACKVRSRLYVMPLYGRLGSEEQEKVFDPAPEGLIKVVVATNVAETSITIDGVTAVVDTGLAKLNTYNPRTFTSALAETPISRASADQRKGRAGRTRPGECYRLFSESDFNSRPAYTREEIYRTDLTEVVLRMAEIGIRDFGSFPFISSPGSKGMRGAVKALHMLDAIDTENALTVIGQQMTPYPLMPRHARMIVESMQRYPDVLREVIILSAFLSTNAPYLLPQGEEMEARKAHHTFRSERYGDFASYLNLYWDYIDAPDREKFAEQYYLDKKILDEVAAIVAQLENITGAGGVPVSEGGSTEDFLKASARGLIPFICVRDGRFDYRSVGVDRIIIHPGSVLFRENPEFIVAGEIIHTSRMYARSVSPLQKEWLVQIHPDLPRRLFAKSPAGRRRERGFDSASARRGNKQADSPRKKDSSNQVWVAGESFPLTFGKGKKKRAVFEWERLREALGGSDADSMPDYGSLRGALFLNNTQVLPDSTVNTIIKTARFIDPKKDVRNAAPRGKFHISNPTHTEALLQELRSLLTLIRGSKKAKFAMGFTTLCSDGKGQYWFRFLRSFHGAVSTSLESLEDLADHVGNELNGRQSKVLGETYRRVEALL